MSFAQEILSAAQGKVGPTASGMWICSNSGATNGAMPGASFGTLEGIFHACDVCMAENAAGQEPRRPSTLPFAPATEAAAHS